MRRPPFLALDVVSGLIVALLTGCGAKKSTEACRFDGHARWHSGLEASGQPSRLSVAKTLVGCHSLEGKSLVTISAMLGKPYYGVGNINPRNMPSWIVGVDDLGDNILLEMQIADDGKASQVRIER